ncbi:hypothetical protein FSP39_020502, partial [Pinctada imbricata]
DQKCQLKWKWLVFAASFFGILCSAGFLYSLTVLFVELLEEFQKSKAETSLVQAVGFGFFLCSGFIAGVLVSKFGEQKCMLLGTLMSTFGIGISYFAVNIPYLVCSIGVIGDVVLSINNPNFRDNLHEIHSHELEIKEATESDRSTLYLDILLSVDENGHLDTSLNARRDDFSSNITNFPFNIPSSPAYAVFVSQLILYAGACSKCEDFIVRARRLASKLFRVILHND